MSSLPSGLRTDLRKASETLCTFGAKEAYLFGSLTDPDSDRRREDIKPVANPVLNSEPAPHTGKGTGRGIDGDRGVKVAWVGDVLRRASVFTTASMSRRISGARTSFERASP